MKTTGHIKTPTDRLKSLIKEFNFILDYNGVLIVSGILINQKNKLINFIV